MGGVSCKEEKVPSQISTDHRDTQRDIKTQEQEGRHMRIKEEEMPPQISTDGSSNRNLPKRCPSPLFSSDFTRERHKNLRCYQYKRLKHIKTEVTEKAEETYLRGDKPFKKEEIPPEISTDPKDTRVTQRNAITEAEEERHVNTKGKAVLEIGMDGQYRLQNMGKNPTTSTGGDDITAEEKAFRPNPPPVSLKEKKRFLCSECGKCFTHKQTLIVHQRTHTGEKPFLCTECGKCFSYNSHLTEHRRTHPEVDPFSCSQCGRRFRTWRILAMHQRVHLGENVYQCSQCGQGFFKNANLKKHERLHRRLKSC